MFRKTEENYRWYALSCTTLGALLSVINSSNGMVLSAGAVIGPVIGGIFTAFDWRWVFFFNLPLGVIGTIWAALQLREVVKLPQGQRLDWQGTLLFTAGFALILLALTFGDMVGWLTPWIMASLACGLMFLFAFVYVETHTDQPMLDLSLFRRRLLAAAYTCNFKKREVLLSAKRLSL